MKSTVFRAHWRAKCDWNLAPFAFRPVLSFGEAATGLSKTQNATQSPVTSRFGKLEATKKRLRTAF